MKNFAIKLVLAFMLVVFISCDEENNIDFLGEDNYLTELSLKIADKTYKSAIVGDKIVMYVPENLSLEKAIVEYKVSETATISPDPKEKTNWNEEDRFVVTSHNNERREYIYVIKRSSVSTSGNIVLNSQSDVDAFAANANSEIDGNLIIGKQIIEGDTITSLAALSSIKNIAYDLIIHNGYKGKDLVGLESLEKVGSIVINKPDSLKTIYLPNLRSVGTIFDVTATNLESVKVDVLDFVGDNFSLKSDKINEMSFNALSTIGASMTINGSTGTSAVSPLERIQFPSLKEIHGALMIAYWAKTYVFEMSKLENIEGALTFKTMNAIDNINLATLKTVNTVSFESLTAEDIAVLLQN